MFLMWIVALTVIGLSLAATLPMLFVHRRQHIPTMK
jgi:hypothetical protein